MRIVLATGDTDLRLSLELLLSEEPGIKIVGGASDTEGFLALIKSTCPDLAMLDWDLPGRPVEEVLNQTKLLKDRPKLIILGRHPGMKEKALQVGADAYVDTGDKPEKLIYTFRDIHFK